MRQTVRYILLLAAFYLISLAFLDFAFPVSAYLRGFTHSTGFVVSNYLLLAGVVSCLTGGAFALGMRGKSRVGSKVARTTALQFILVAGFAIACSGAGFGLSLGDFPFFGRFGYFFMEFQFLEFIFVAAAPLALYAGVLYFLAARRVGV